MQRALSRWCSRQDHALCDPGSVAGRLCECPCHGFVRFLAHPTATNYAKRLSEVLGIDILTAGSEAETEQVDFVVCIRADDPTNYTDNLHTPCTKCGVEVQYRPHAPKKPQKVCLPCAMLVFEEEFKKDHP